jgi:hypothetical protein
MSKQRFVRYQTLIRWFCREMRNGLRKSHIPASFGLISPPDRSVEVAVF